MNKKEFDSKMAELFADHKKLIERKNEKLPTTNGIFWRYKYPILEAEHTPIFWRYDLDHKSNPFLMERLRVNVAFNAGAMEFNGKIALAVRIEAVDRKSFFAIAESESGVDNFKYRDYPIVMPETSNPDINVYDMRLVKHQDGWIYGIFCTERKDPNAGPCDTVSAAADCGIARTKDLDTWQRLDDFKSPSPQMRNLVLHPEFVDGKYLFYTRPQSGFIDPGSGEGIGWALCDSMEHAVATEQHVLDPRLYHTVKEVKNGLGPAPIKTEKGWLQLAHGVRNTAAGLRYILYVFMTSLDEPMRVIYAPGGHFMAPQGPERVGDVSNVLFSGGWVLRDSGELFIYYASSDTRMHVATTTLDRMVDYVVNTPSDPGRTYACVQQRKKLIDKNLAILKSKK